jgi:hypothetical protein
VASRDKDVESRLARQNQHFFREPKATRSGVRRFTGCTGVRYLKLSLCNAKQRYGVDFSNFAKSNEFYSGHQWGLTDTSDRRFRAVRRIGNDIKKYCVVYPGVLVQQVEELAPVGLYAGMLAAEQVK